VSYRGLLLLCAIFVFATFGVAFADEEEAYFGEWSNANGDMLRITSEGIQWNTEKPLPYDDITEDSDGSFYLLQITGPDEPHSFSGKFLRITFGTDADQFTLTTYRTQSDALNQVNESGRSEWTAVDDDDDDEV
jgi:hypothetical protein